jgi:hypothetical protein
VIKSIMAIGREFQILLFASETTTDHAP